MVILLIKEELYKAVVSVPEFRYVVPVFEPNLTLKVKVVVAPAATK